MPSIAIFPFDVDEEMDFDISFKKFLALKKDRPADSNPLTLVAQPEGITLIHMELVDATFAKLWLRDPEATGDYKFKVLLNTYGGRKKSAEITIRVSD